MVPGVRLRLFAISSTLKPCSNMARLNWRVILVGRAVAGLSFFSFFGFSVAYWGYRLQPVNGGTVITEQWRDLRTVPLFHWGPVIKLITGITDRIGTNEWNMRVTLDRLKAAAER